MALISVAQLFKPYGVDKKQPALAGTLGADCQLVAESHAVARVQRLATIDRATESQIFSWYCMDCSSVVRWL